MQEACSPASAVTHLQTLATAYQPPPPKAAAGPWAQHDFHAGQDHTGQSNYMPGTGQDGPREPPPSVPKSMLLPAPGALLPLAQLVGAAAPPFEQLSDSSADPKNQIAATVAFGSD